MANPAPLRTLNFGEEQSVVCFSKRGHYHLSHGVQRIDIFEGSFSLVRGGVFMSDTWHYHVLGPEGYRHQHEDFPIGSVVRVRANQCDDSGHLLLEAGALVEIAFSHPTCEHLVVSWKGRPPTHILRAHVFSEAQVSGTVLLQ